LPQNWHGYGRESVCISRCVDKVDDLLNDLPHWLHENDRNDAGAGVDVDVTPAAAAVVADIGGHAEPSVCSSPKVIASLLTPPRMLSVDETDWR
jgi:hypothetical protein